MNQHRNHVVSKSERAEIEMLEELFIVTPEEEEITNAIRRNPEYQAVEKFLSN